jgi:hypothetical protein
MTDTADVRRVMGTAEDAERMLAEAASEWRRLRQPLIAPAREQKRRELEEREARFKLAGAALLWLWHRENPEQQQP